MSRQPRAIPATEGALAPGGRPDGPGPSAAGPDVRAVYAEHFSYVWHSVRRLGVPEKDLPDVVHDVFVAVARALPSYDAKRPIKPWLFGVAFRVTSDHLRLYRHTREVLGRQEDPPDIAPTPEQALLAQEARALAAASLAQLDVAHRAVLIMFDIEGHDAHQIALALDIPLKTVYSRLRTARLGFSAAAARLMARRGAR